jgi:prepilin-type N-terminal cleavage/methylation domain-containing protein
MKGSLMEFSRPRAKEAGFTLAEMLVAISLFLILGFLAVPRLALLQATFNRVNARGYILQDIKRAQAETVTQGCRGVLKIESGGKSYIYGCDYLAYDTIVPPSPDKISFRRFLPEKITVAASGPIIFNSRGWTVDSFDIISNVTITLSEYGDSGLSAFASGLLNGTGVFTYN